MKARFLSVMVVATMVLSGCGSDGGEESFAFGEPADAGER